jgi:hypothetical protein
VTLLAFWVAIEHQHGLPQAVSDAFDHIESFIVSDDFLEDFSCTMEIFDPSINFYEPGNTFQSPHTHIVTCFAARMEDLPEQIHQFDIVLLRNLKVCRS